MEYPETVSLRKAGELTGVSRRTLYNWMRDGKVDFVRTAGGSRRIVTTTLWRDKDGQALTSPSSAS